MQGQILALTCTLVPLLWSELSGVGEQIRPGASTFLLFLSVQASFVWLEVELD